MFEAADIREWRGHNVVDEAGHKVGTLESVYVDTGTDQPALPTSTDPLGFIEHSVLRVDTGDMRDTTYIDTLVGPGDIPNDGDDIQKAYQAELNYLASKNIPPAPGADPTGAAIYADGTAYTGEGVYWYDI